MGAWGKTEAESLKYGTCLELLLRRNFDHEN